MKRIALLLLAAASLWGRSAETVYFRAILSPANEVPAINIEASGTATVRAHIVRDDAGQVAEGSVDFVAGYSFPGPVTITGMHIHNGPAGVNAGVVINSGLSGTNSVTDATGRGTLDLQGQVRPGDDAGVAALRGMLANPSGYYLNIHTTDFPGGVIRGQLQRAETALFMGLMSPLNEVPAITGVDASGTSSVLVITTRDAAGAFTSAQMIFDVNYRMPGQVTFTGFHIHNGPAGVNAGVIFNTGIGAGAASVVSDPSGVGRITRPVEVNLGVPAQATSLAGLLANPAGYYINLHTTEYPGGVIRAQLRPTDTMRFPVTMLPSNEVPPVAIDASGPARVGVHTVRYEDGSVQAGVVVFDVDYRFPGAVEFTGLHIHNGAAGTNGPVIINTGLSAASSVKSETGFGNIFRSVIVADAAGLDTLNSLVANPEKHYVNLHTTVNPAGVIRSQLAAADTAAPVVNAMIAANLDKNATTVAPGGLVSIFGTNLAKVTVDLSGWQGQALPDLLNGVAVAVGGARARLLYVSPGQVNAALAMETPAGQQLLSLNNGNAPSAPVPVTVAQAAPAIFFGPAGALALKNADFSLVGADNPAHAGDVVLLYATGFGQTTPALGTGVLAPASPLSNTVPATVTIGGKNADVVYSIAAPGFAGLYQVAVRVPAGLLAGNQPVVITAGGMSSNSAGLAVQ